MPNHGRIRWLVPLLALLALAPAPALAAPGDEPGSALAIGTSLGVSFLSSEGSDLTVISFPQGTSLFTTVPGLRFGHVSAGRGFEFGLDTAIQYASAEGSSVHVVVFGLGFERHFVRESSFNPFVGAEVGIVSADLFEDLSQPYAGVSVGVRNVIAKDNGSVKFLLRYRRHFEDDDNFVSAYNEVNAALAFDLWIPR